VASVTNAAFRDNKERAERWFSQGWAGDAELADAIFEDPFLCNGVLSGRNAAKRSVVSRIIGFPDLQIDIEDVVVGDQSVVVRLSWSGTHRGACWGIAPTNARVTVPVIAAWKFRGPLVIADWTIEDHLSCLQQMGVVTVRPAFGDGAVEDL
jgi:predicted ester cyclase